MNSIDSAVNSLIKAIYESTQYKTFNKLKAKIDEEEEIKNSLNQFRNKRFLLESQSQNGINPSKEDIKALQEMYSSLMMNPEVSAFLQSEISLSKMVLEIYKEIGEALKFELDFINE